MQSAELQELAEQGRMSEAEATAADERGYAVGVNGHGLEEVAVTLLRVDPNEMGDIKDFTFTDPKLLGERLQTLFSVSQ